MNGKLLDRVQLYEQVWSKPMTKLAADYGLSDNGLRKICAKLNVPIPKVGYWQKIQYGRTVKREPLPAFDGAQEVTITPTQKDQKIQDTNQPPEIVAEFLPENKITVPKVLDKPHSLIQTVKKDLTAKNRFLDKGRVTGYRDHLNICVAPVNVDRALRIMDTLIKALEKRGRKIEVTAEHGVCVRWENEFLEFDLRETYKMVKKETEDVYNRHDYIPTGILVLRIGTQTWNTRNQWSDNKKKVLEDQLNDFIVGLYDEFKERRQWKLNREREDRERQERYRQAEETQRKQELELQKKQALEKDALNWQKSQIIKSYVENLKKLYIEKNGEIKQGSEFEVWITWANQHIESLDPLK